MSDELEELVREAYSHTYGAAQNALLEQVVARAEAEGDEDAAFSYRLRLADAYGQSGEPRLSFAPFARCVADLDADPGRFGKYRSTILWGYKSIVHAMTYFPEVGLEQTHAMLAEMERRYLDAGHGLHAVHQHRWLVAFHVGDADAAEEHFRAWITAPRDAMSDCAGCDPNDQVRHLHWVGRDAEAVELGLGTLARPLPCREQPHHLQTELLPSLVAEGRLDEARDAHQRGYRTMRTLAGQVPGLARHLRFCTATGNLGRALEIFDRHRHELLGQPQPLAGMELRAVAARALRELAATSTDAVVTDEHDVVGPAGALAERYAAEARAVAARFDERNRTRHQGERVEGLLTEDRWVEHLPLLALPVTRPARTSTAADAGVRGAPAPERAREEPSATAGTEVPPGPTATPTELPDPAEADLDALLDLVEDALAEDRVDVVRAALERFVAERPADAQSEQERGRVAYARAALIDLDEHEEGWARAEADALRTALVHLDAAGDELRLNRTRATLGLHLAQQGELEEATATAADALVWLSEHDEPERRPGWTFRRILLDRSAGRRQQAYETLRAMFAEPSGSAERDEHVALMLAQDELSLGRFAEAEGAATRAVGSADPERWRWARRFRADARRALGDHDGAVQDRLEALAGDSRVPDAADDPRLVLSLAEDYLAAGRGSEGVEAGEVALRLAQEGSDPEPLQGAWLLLLRGYKALDEPELALEQVTALEEALVDDPAPGFVGGLLEEKGELLHRLQRHGDALAAFEGSAAAYERAGAATPRVRALRWAKDAAERDGSPDRATALREEAQTVAEGLPDDDGEGWFHRGWLWIERGQAEHRAGRTTEALAAFEQAESTFHRGGLGDQATEAVLARLELVGADVEDVRAVFVGAKPRSRVWYRSGWLLADRLRAAGREQEADSLEDELEDE